ncbi:glycerol-3-phosphate acyltransferase 1, mitochondrial [Zerene cesonia]|uniref:glycerol-3-phosphate acyltransferase 1, mitochondrial n=1 Tax=Zerene cesonia TaxID=33412 RepID=UPI0018E54A6A|nr:glycerol-3-phosphate acyltransferase 1, mitochondrial [Zerene cesonia]XP_038219412.1 glycerol-3-phosphate acyltransferase 1, mitochondrial [Zerene cesonia]
MSVNNWTGNVNSSVEMETMINVWTVVEHVRVTSSAAELAIFTAILYWFFTSSRVADMLEVVGERVGGWCGRDTTSLRQAVRTRKRQHADVYAKLDAEVTTRTSSLYRMKDGPIVPPPQPQTRPTAGLACARCAPLSRESWQDAKSPDAGAVINILDIGRQTFANGGVVSRYLCDLAQCLNLVKYDYKDVVPSVAKDERFQRAIEEKTKEELKKAQGEERGKDAESRYMSVRKRVEAKAMKVLIDISSAMSNNVLRLVAWVCHKAVRRVAGGGCGTRAASAERLRRANAAGLPLVFVPLHRSHFDYILVTFTLYLTGLRPPLVAAGDNMRIPFFGWFLRGCGAFYIRRRVDGSEYHEDPVYKSALRAYILNSLAANNNLEFFIEGGRTRTGKPQPPKAGILSVILEAYLDGTIDDALLVPVTLNYDKLVDGNFVREQLGMPKQMETFWSALRGIWRTLNTNHGSIRVDFNQPISLKELVTSFQRYIHLKAPPERPLSPPSDDLNEDLDRRILYNHSHSSFYGAHVSADHKMMVEAIGRHLVYDASQSTALMCTNVVAYVLLAEQRGGCSLRQLERGAEARARRLLADGRDLGYAGDTAAVVRHALDMLGRGVVRRWGGRVRAQAGVAAALELSYYANAVVAHYAAPAIIATALESILCEPGADQEQVRHGDLMERALQLCAVLGHEFVLCAPCQRLRERLLDDIARSDLLQPVQNQNIIEEQRWSQRFARSLEDDEEEQPDPTRNMKYRINKKPEAIAERRRLVLTLRPLIEAYSATCKCLKTASQKEIVTDTLDRLTEEFTQNRMLYGEAVSTDAIRNCLRLLRQWGVIDMHTDNKIRKIRLVPPYDNERSLQEVCNNIHIFNMDSPLLEKK